MTDTVKRADYCHASVQDQAGEGVRLLEALRTERVNLVAFHAFPAGDGRTQLDLFPADPARLTAAARLAGIELSPVKTAFRVEGEDRTGAMAEILGKLGRAGINVTAAEGICAGAGRFGALVWVKPQDVERAAQALSAQ